MICLPAIQRRNLGRALLAGYLAFCAVYLGSAAVAPGPRTILAPGIVDAWFPFLPWTIWIYYSQFLLLVASLAATRADADRTRGFYAMLLATLLAALVFVSWPTAIERPTPPQDGITGIVWSVLHFTDTPANCFPSLHVALAAISGILLWRGGWRLAAVAWPAAIAFSTLSTRQHVAWDIPGGLVLAALAWSATPRLIRHERPHPLPDPAGS
jgi:hypothetical protein